jgi:hypothetical protein
LLFNSLKEPAEGNLQIYSFGGALGLYAFPLSRLFTQLDGALGVYEGVGENSRSKPGFWWRAGAEAGFRFTPSFTLAAAGGWRQYQSANGSGGVFNSGLYAGLLARITLETRSARDGVNIAVVQDDGIYPLFLSLYQESPAARLRIRNDESAEIRNVRVSFRAGNYTSSEFSCGTIPLIGKRRTMEVDLLADFSPELLNFTENGRIVGEVVIRYTLLGREREAVRSAAVRVYNRNSFPVEDWAALAAFVSPTAPEILEYSKAIAGLARTRRRTGLNQPMQTGMWLFEGLRAGGLGLRTTGAANTSRLAIQFPAQTLAYKSGAVVDMALLYSAVLEAAGIRAAIIPLAAATEGSPLAGGEFLVALDLGINSGDAVTAALFNGTGKLLIVGDEVWLPLALSKFDDGFSSAWTEGARRVAALLADDEGADMVIFEDAWGIYPPAPLPALGVRITQAAEGAMTRGAEQALREYLESELEPKIQTVNEQIRQAGSGSSSAALYNQAGNLYARTDKREEAKAAYERAAGMGSVSAMVNRGNIALLEKDSITAEQWFKQALAVQPEHAAALWGMEQVAAQRGDE